MQCPAQQPHFCQVEANGINLHLIEQGSGPLVVLCHGFPETSHSWRHQMEALATAGFHVVAPDMRGYGLSDRPEAIDQYTLLHLVGDMLGLLDALGAETAIIAGHDWGAPVAWHAALLRPDRFRGVIALSVPFGPWMPVQPTSAMPQTDDAVFYQLYFQDPGIAEAELERDARDALRRIFCSLAGDATRNADVAGLTDAVGMVSRQGGLLAGLVDPPVLPPWLTEDDLEVYAEDFARTGFRGGLNWYRNIDRNWELLSTFAGARVQVPALFIAGDRDLVLGFRGADRLVNNLRASVPRLRQSIILPGCGHWTQQERPQEVNAAMLAFLRDL